MSNTYSQIHIQCVFAVKYRDAVISKSWQERLHKYIIAIINNNDHRLLSINPARAGIICIYSLACGLTRRYLI